MPILFRQNDANYAFLFPEGISQPPARWHGEGDGPAQYFATTPDGAWAELLRHEEITEELTPAVFNEMFSRVLWAIDFPNEIQITEITQDRLTLDVCIGDEHTYLACQQAARALRNNQVRCLQVRTAALHDGQAQGAAVGPSGQLTPGPSLEGKTIVYFGTLPKAVGWRCGTSPVLDENFTKKVRHFSKATVTTRI